MFAPYNGIPRCSGRCLHRPAPQAGSRPSGPMTSIGPYSKDVEEFRPRRGQSGKREKSVKKNAALLHFLGFFPLTLLFGVPRGACPPWAGFAASQQRDFFASFLVTKRKVLKAGCCYKRLSPQGGDNRRAAHKNIKDKKKHPAVPGRVPRIRKKVGGDWLSYLPRCQMSASYSAMVRSLLNMPALAMLIRHLRRQPSGS